VSESPHPTRDARPRRILAVGGLATSVVLWLIEGRLLRMAHLYRQRTDEGLKLFWLQLPIVATTVVNVVSIWAAVRWSRQRADRRSLPFAVAAAATLLLVCALALNWYVYGLGKRCWGTCD
jgi:hypothetical protein